MNNCKPTFAPPCLFIDPWIFHLYVILSLNVLCPNLMCLRIISFMNIPVSINGLLIFSHTYAWKHPDIFEIRLPHSPPRFPYPVSHQACESVCLSSPSLSTPSLQFKPSLPHVAWDYCKSYLTLLLRPCVFPFLTFSVYHSKTHF